MKDVHALKQGLAHFYGTEAYHRVYPTGTVLLTDGALYLAKEAEAFWLMDIIWSIYPKLQNMDFHAVELTVKEEKGVVIVTDGNDGEIYRQVIEYTDFPLEKQRLFVSTAGENSQGRPIKVVMLPGEY